MIFKRISWGCSVFNEHGTMNGAFKWGASGSTTIPPHQPRWLRWPICCQLAGPWSVQMPPLLVLRGVRAPHLTYPPSSSGLDMFITLCNDSTMASRFSYLGAFRPQIGLPHITRVQWQHLSEGLQGRGPWADGVVVSVLPTMNRMQQQQVRQGEDNSSLWGDTTS